MLHFSSAHWVILSVLSAFKGKLSDMKSTWSQGPISQSQASLSHELWKVPQGPRSSTAPSRPPPGLTNNKPSSTWGGNSLGLAQGWSGSYSSGERSPLNHRPYRNMVMSFSPLRFFFFFLSQDWKSIRVSVIFIKRKSGSLTQCLNLKPIFKTLSKKWNCLWYISRPANTDMTDDA